MDVFPELQEPRRIKFCDSIGVFDISEMAKLNFLKRSESYLSSFFELPSVAVSS